ncbi:unnamed protein product [Moneuplotes crassus]|uniref:Uncharacterized protein n=1 Tax=Euplotes crassus TaxID=5936 RepID=A0AAD1XJL9_EUPCR|nr:unnamed protein product [Moneuplotes crassus]
MFHKFPDYYESLPSLLGSFSASLLGSSPSIIFFLFGFFKAKVLRSCCCMYAFPTVCPSSLCEIFLFFCMIFALDFLTLVAAFHASCSACFTLLIDISIFGPISVNSILLSPANPSLIVPASKCCNMIGVLFSCAVKQIILWEARILVLFRCLILKKSIIIFLNFIWFSERSNGSPWNNKIGCCPISIEILFLNSTIVFQLSTPTSSMSSSCWLYILEIIMLFCLFLLWLPKRTKPQSYLSATCSK